MSIYFLKKNLSRKPFLYVDKKQLQNPATASSNDGCISWGMGTLSDALCPVWSDYFIILRILCPSQVSGNSDSRKTSRAIWEVTHDGVPLILRDISWVE